MPEIADHVEMAVESGSGAAGDSSHISITRGVCNCHHGNDCTDRRCSDRKGGGGGGGCVMEVAVENDKGDGLGVVRN